MTMAAPTNFSSTVFQEEVAAIPTSDSQSSTIFPQHRVRIDNHNSRWMKELAERFDDIVGLSKGWDGYAGEPVSFTTAQFAAQMIERLCIPDVPAPSIVPGSDGSLQVEWHVGGFDIELDVTAPLAVDAYRMNQNTGAEDELEVESDFTQIAQWISEVAYVRQNEKLDQAAG